MNNKEYYKHLSKEVLEKLGYAATPARLKRVKFLIMAFELQENDPDSQFYVSGKYSFSIDGRAKNICAL